MCAVPSMAVLLLLLEVVVVAAVTVVVAAAVTGKFPKFKISHSHGDKY